MEKTERLWELGEKVRVIKTNEPINKKFIGKIGIVRRIESQSIGTLYNLSFAGRYWNVGFRADELEEGV